MSPTRDTNGAAFCVTQRPDGIPGANMKQLAVCNHIREMAVSYLKLGDKTEALVVRYECRDGSQRMWISPIVRSKAGGVALGDALEIEETAAGRFASLF